MRSTEHLLMIRLGDAQRRNTDPIPLCKSLCAICPLFIDTDFAIAQQPVQMAFGDAFDNTEQKIVDTLPGATVVYLNHCHALGLCLVRGPHSAYIIQRCKWREKGAAACIDILRGATHKTGCTSKHEK